MKLNKAKEKIKFLNKDKNETAAFENWMNKRNETKY